MSHKHLLNDKIEIYEIAAINTRSRFEIDKLCVLTEKQLKLSYFPLSKPAFSISIISINAVDSPIIRGNHYHTEKDEYLYLISGHVIYKFIDLDTKSQLIIEPGRNEIIHVYPNCAHAYLVEGNTSILEFSTKKVKNWDSIRSAVADNFDDFINKH